jgi:hypothetical protein
MVAFKQLAGVIFAVMFLAIVGAIYISYSRNSAKSDFERDSESLAQQIRLLVDYSENTTWIFNIDVPADCELQFENKSVVAIVDNVHKYHDVGISVDAKLTTPISGRKARLTLKRTENGVTING